MNASMAGILTLIFIIGFFFLRKYASSRVDRILESDRIYITRVENYPFHNEPTENGTV